MKMCGLFFDRHIFLKAVAVIVAVVEFCFFSLNIPTDFVCKMRSGTFLSFEFPLWRPLAPIAFGLHKIANFETPY